MLELPDMHMLARAVQGGKGEEQWMDRVLVTTPERVPIVEVAIKPCSHFFNFNRSRSHPNAFESIDVRVGKGAFSMRPWTYIPPADAVYSWNGIQFTFTRIRP